MLVLIVVLLTVKAALSFPSPLPSTISGPARQLQEALQNTNPPPAQIPTLTFPPGTALDTVITKLTDFPLDIIKMEVGDSPATLRMYTDNALTEAFHPGDEVFFRLTVKNKLTASTPVQTLVKTIENIELTAQASLTGFPADLIADGVYFLAPGEEKVVTFSYTIPVSAAGQSYPLTFTIQGEDLQNPAVSYHSDRAVGLKVVREAHRLKVIPTVNAVVSCPEKQAGARPLLLTLANIGSTSETVSITINMVGTEQIETLSATLTSGQQQILSWELPGIRQTAGAVQYEIVVFRSSLPTLEYFREIIDLQVDNCAPAFEDFPDTITLNEGSSRLIRLSQYIHDVEGDALTFSVSAASTLQNIDVLVNAEVMTITPRQADWFGTEDFILTVSDGTAQVQRTISVVVQQLFDEIPTITSMTAPSVAIGDTDSFDFTVAVSNPDAAPLTYTWYVDDMAQAGATTAAFRFQGSAFSVGMHVVKVVVNEGQDTEVEEAQSITTASKPTDLVSFAGSATTPASQITNPASVAGFTLENAFGKIVFTQNVDLSDILQLVPLVAVQSNQIAVDTANAPELNKPATITLYGATFVHPVILKSVNFNAGPFVTCPATECQVVSTANGMVTFTVSGFSTYQVQEQPSVGVEVVEGEVFFAQVPRNQSATVNITVRNRGANQTLTGLTTEFVGVAAKYAVQVSGLPVSLAAGQQATVAVQMAVPADEAAGKHTLGTLKIKSDQIETSVPITLSPKSFLTISKFEVNGKSSGELELNAVNKVSVTIDNTYTQDMEDVAVTVEILDVDGEDLEEEVDAFDLDDGDDKEVTVEFDLTGEHLEEDKYTIKVIVKGTAEDDNTDHEAEFSKDVEVERENHQVILQRADASSTLLKCTRQTTLNVVVENVGKSDEDEVEVRLSNSVLGISQNRADIELDAFDGSDNEYKTSFQLNLQNAAAGAYPVTVNVYRDGDLVDTKEVALTVESCATIETSTTTGRQTTTTSSGVTDDLARQIQQQIQQRAQQEVVEDVSISSISFRDSREYEWLLKGMVVLLVLAVVLGLAVLMKRR